MIIQAHLVGFWGFGVGGSHSDGAQRRQKLGAKKQWQRGIAAASDGTSRPNIIPAVGEGATAAETEGNQRAVVENQRRRAAASVTARSGNRNWAQRNRGGAG